MKGWTSKLQIFSRMPVWKPSQHRCISWCFDRMWIILFSCAFCIILLLVSPFLIVTFRCQRMGFWYTRSHARISFSQKGTGNSYISAVFPPSSASSLKHSFSSTPPSAEPCSSSSLPPLSSFRTPHLSTSLSAPPLLLPAVHWLSHKLFAGCSFRPFWFIVARC